MNKRQRTEYKKDEQGLGKGRRRNNKKNKKHYIYLTKGKEG